MTTLQKFENLNGSKISRKDLQDLILEAKIKNETVVVYRLSKILLDNPTTEVFEIELKQYPTSLNAPRHKGSYKEALSECGRLKKGWKFEKGNVVKVVKKPQIKTTKKVVKTLKAKVKSKTIKKNDFVLNTLSKKFKKQIFSSSINELKRLTTFSDKELATASKNMLSLVNRKHFVLLNLKHGYLRSSNKQEYYNIPVYINKRIYQKNINDLSSAEVKFLLAELKSFKYETAWNDLYSGNFNDIQYNIKKLEKSKQLKLALAGTAKTKETVSFNKKIIKAKRNGIDFRKNYSLGRSKGVLKKHIGDHEIIISGGVLKKAMEKDKDHIATYENFINFPDAINEPLAIFNSKTKKDSKIVLTEVISYKEKPLMVALHFNKINGVFRIASVYSKTNTSVYKKWFKEGLCVYYNKKSSNELLLAPIAVSHTVKGRNKDTKNNSTSKVFKKKGLGNPLQDHNSLAYKLSNRQNRVTEFYNISENDIAEFLGKIEKKEKESVVITVTGGQGSMKTRYAFRFMDALAKNYKVGHASIEEHPDSSLYWNKVHEYISEQSLQNISNPEINDIQQLDHLIKSNDVIIIDSFAKMQELERGFEVDKDLRKKYDGKLFLVIFQQTSDGKMRGGTKSQYDADIVLFTEKFDDYEQNFVYADKNRYQNKTLCDLKYNIFRGKLNPLEPR